MNRQMILVGVGLSMVVGYVAFRLGVVAVPTPIAVTRTPLQERGYAGITERTVNGHDEFYTTMMPLVADWTKPDYRITAVMRDPSRPPLMMIFRDVAERPETWEVEAKKPIAVIADGKRRVMKPYQAMLSDDGSGVEVIVSVGGPETILAAVAAATKVEIEFGGRRYDLGERGLANCRELLKRSEANEGVTTARPI